MQRKTSCWQILAVLVALGFAALPVLGCSGGRAEPAANATPVPPTSVPLPRIDGRRVLFVVPDGFIDIEYRITRRILEEVGATIIIASWSTDALVGSSGETLQPEVQLGDVHAGDFDAIVFVGGDHVKPTDPETQHLVEQAVAEGKLLAAICAGQGILKEAGLWEGGRGGVYLERRDRIIVASGSIKAREFAESIAVAMAE
jgi:putative intracellular protease/amidase